MFPTMTLDTLQAGALLALAAFFGADSRQRRDSTLAWLALACLIVSLRHVSGMLELSGLIALDLGKRLDRVMGLLGFLGVMKTMSCFFVESFPHRILPKLFLGMLPFLLANLLLPMDTLVYLICHWVFRGVLLTGMAIAVLILLRERRSKEVFSKRLGTGLMLQALLGVTEIVLVSVWGMRIRLTGLGMVALALMLALSWMKLLSRHMVRREEHALMEAEAWRSVIPGITWTSWERHPMMADLFGAGWADRLHEHMRGIDGSYYLLRRSPVPGRGEVGYVEGHAESIPGSGDFLAGWSVALGLDEGEELERVGTWLRQWGARIEIWGAVPPRSGPYPNLILWNREPMFLQVWREGDLARRLPRWIQIGGARVDGPHARLDRPIAEMALHRALLDLLNPQQGGDSRG